MNTSPRFRVAAVALATLLVSGLGCDSADPLQPPSAPTATQPAPPPVAAKRVALNPDKTLFFETLPDGQRRVVVLANVCLREGMLEVFMCRKNTKEHEAILHAEVDARAIHAALEAAGLKAGHTVQYQPKFEPPAGPTVRLTVQYEENGKTVTRRAQEWVRDAKTKKQMPFDWVFAGSRLYPDPDDATKVPFYGANSGDVITVSNFPDAMLDLPVNSPKDNSDLNFEAFTERIPPLKTPVTVFLEPAGAKKQ
jgi:hypothetical protein